MAYEEIESRRERIERSEYKQFLREFSGNRFTTVESEKRRKEFYSWVNDNQDFLKNKYASINNGDTPPIFAGTLHGSVARGEAHTESDIDGTIFYKFKPHEDESQIAQKMESHLPSKEWAVRFVNIQSLQEYLIRLDQYQRDLDEELGTHDLVQDEIRERFRSLSLDFASLFGPGSNTQETDEFLDSMRSEILKSIMDLQHVSPEIIWRMIQDAWRITYVEFSKDRMKRKKVIAQALRDQGYFKTSVEEVLQLRRNDDLPDLNQMKRAYLG